MLFLVILIFVLGYNQARDRNYQAKQYEQNNQFHSITVKKRETNA